MPMIAKNPRNDSDAARLEYQIGSLPIGSWFDIYNVNDVLIYRGYVAEDRTTWGYVIVQPITEGDGNFDGSADRGDLRRLYGLNERHKVQAECPVTWLGVDEELRQELRTELVTGMSDQGGVDDPSCPPQSASSSALRADMRMSLLPVVSLVPVPEEVTDDAEYDS